jgi:hypothetical protein
MSSVSLPHEPLDDASRLVPEGKASPGGFASLCRQCDRAQFVQGRGFFFVDQEQPPRIFLIFQKVSGEASFGNSWSKGGAKDLNRSRATVYKADTGWTTTPWHWWSWSWV